MGVVDEMVDCLRNHFQSVPLVHAVGNYRNVPYIEISAEDMRFAIEIRVLENGAISLIEVVSRDEKTQLVLANRFMRSWAKGMSVYERGSLVLAELDLPAKLPEVSSISEVLKVLRSLVIQLLTPGSHETAAMNAAESNSKLMAELLDAQKLHTRNHVLEDMSMFMVPKQLSCFETLERIKKTSLV